MHSSQPFAPTYVRPSTAASRYTPESDSAEPGNLAALMKNQVVMFEPDTLPVETVVAVEEEIVLDIEWKPGTGN